MCIAVQDRRWAELMKRAFAIDVEQCARCARMRWRALVTTAQSIERFLRHIGGERNGATNEVEQRTARAGLQH